MFAARSVSPLLSLSSVALALALVGCDGVPSDSYSVALSEDGHIVLEQEWTLPLGSDRGDVLFKEASVLPGHAVHARLEGEGQAVSLTSAHDLARGEHHVGIDLDGISVSRAELVFQGFDDVEVLAAAAADVADLPEPSLSREPASVHYGYGTDDGGNEVLVVSYDYHDGGAIVNGVTEPESKAPVTKAEPAVQGMEVEYVGYRLVLNGSLPDWSTLRIHGFDQLSTESAAFAYNGEPTPMVLRQRAVPATPMQQ